MTVGLSIFFFFKVHRTRKTWRRTWRRTYWAPRIFDHRTFLAFVQFLILSTYMPAALPKIQKKSRVRCRGKQELHQTVVPRRRNPYLLPGPRLRPFAALSNSTTTVRPAVSVHRSDRKRIVASAWLIFTALDSHKVFIRARTTRLKSLLPLLRSSCSRSALEAFVIYSLQQIPMHHPTAALPTNPMDPSAPLVGWWADSAHVCAAALPPPCDHSTKRRISIKSHVAWLHLYTLESQQKLDQRRETEDCREEQWSYAAIAHLIYVHALRSQEQPRHPC